MNKKEVTIKTEDFLHFFQFYQAVYRLHASIPAFYLLYLSFVSSEVALMYKNQIEMFSQMLVLVILFKAITQSLRDNYADNFPII